MTVAIMKPSYQEKSQPISRRVADLLGRMTLEEKAAQMVCIWNDKSSKLLDDSGSFDPDLAAKHFGDGNGLGQIGRPGDSCGGATPRQFVEVTNAIQEFFVKGSRLGIPVLFHDEALHGLVARQATSFGQPIALASTFNPKLVNKLYRLVARESRACGVHQVLGPVVDVARDPRWGRVEETFGEDPFLVGRMAQAAVEGLQGQPRLGDSDRVIATLKHFAAHGQPESGCNCGPVSISERHLRETFLAPFERAIRRGRAMSVMASYNEIDGVPSHANRWLLRGVLRDEWGFVGTVVSDYYAIQELHNRPDLYGHHVAESKADAALAAVRAGVNIELPEPDCYRHLVQLVQDGKLQMAELDELVWALLAHKFEIGLFDSPYVEPTQAEVVLGCEEHRELAREAAEQSITLLKNEGTLPLDRDKINKIAVIGPNADRELLGGYSGKPKRFVTVLEGLKLHYGGSTEVVYAEGCGITLGGSWEEDVVVASDPETDRRSIAEAVDVARGADVIVLVVGGNEQTSREAWFSNHMGDRTDLQMVGRQDDLVDALHQLGKPIVSLLFNGRPLAVNNLTERSSALLECWYLGQETGTAVARVLSGEVAPSGKLPITIPRSVGHLPCFYNYRPSARRGYLFDDTAPLFPFGFGLSYTNFELGAPRLSRSTIRPTEDTVVLVDVTNAGELPGTETVQVYVRDLVSSATRPVMELKGFDRVALEPGETKTAEVLITPDELGFWNIEKKFVVEPGEFDILVGTSSVDTESVRLLVTESNS